MFFTIDGCIEDIVYNIPYRRARAWPSGCIVQPLFSLYAEYSAREQRYLAWNRKYPIVTRVSTYGFVQPLGRVCVRTKVSCIQYCCIQDTFSSRAALGLPCSAFRPSASREQKYLAYKQY